jgi:hypothetical protein
MRIYGVPLHDGTREDRDIDAEFFQKTGVSRGFRENLFRTEMNNVFEVFAVAEEFPRRLAILRVEEFVRQNETKFAVLVQQTKTALNKHNIDVVVPLARRIVGAPPGLTPGVRPWAGPDRANEGWLAIPGAPTTTTCECGPSSQFSSALWRWRRSSVPRPERIFFNSVSNLP